MALRLLETKTRFFDQDAFGMDKNTAYWGWMKYFLDQTLVDGSTPIDVVSISVREEDLYWLFDLALVEASGYKANLSVVEVFNSTLPILNKIHRVQEVKETQNTITLAILKTDLSLKPNEIPDALGTKVKLAPLGYKKTFEEGLKVVYESANPENKRCYLRVDNGCPVGHDPAKAKFARVSMFSDIRYIDDYEFRLGRVKAPAETDNYTVCETSIKYVWSHVRVSSLNSIANTRLSKYFIIGDDKTFYIFLSDIYISNYNSDCFMFGEYNKLMYKEDPLPFMLYAPFYGTSLGTTPTTTDTFFNSSSGNIHLMSEAFESNFSKRQSDKAIRWEGVTGKFTVSEYKPYKNEIALHPIDFLLSSLRQEGSFLECSLRGIKLLYINIPPNTFYQPYNMQIFPELDYLMFVTEQTTSAYYYSFGIELRDWDGLA